MTSHVPVLLTEIIDFLKTRPRVERVLDCTLGLGGYAEGVLQTFPKAELWGIDQDEDALRIASARLAFFGGRFKALHGNFAELSDLVGDLGPFDGILFDLGVSNLQISEGPRGFSFQEDGPLDMRMDGRNPLTAEQILKNRSEKELSEIFWKFGEERFSRQIARGIVRHRERGGLLESTRNLVDLIRDILPAPVQRKMGGHPARRVFQALRIAVNDELSALEKGLSQALNLAAPGGAVAVVSYHSLEDRIVKVFFKEEQKAGRGMAVTKRPMTPSEEEIERNYKARSAKLRFFTL